MEPHHFIGAHDPRNHDCIKCGRPKAHETHIPNPVPYEWWWTPAKASSRCQECGNSIPEGELLAFRRHESAIACSICADRLGLNPKMSKRAKKLQLSLRGS